MDKSKKSPPNKNQCCGLHLGCYEFVEMKKKTKDLEAKLAEKEKKIESCNHTIYMNMLNQEMLQLKVANLEQSQNQKAIAELDKLRKQLDCEDNYCYGDNNIVICINRTIFNDIIDQQVKELKGEK